MLKQITRLLILLSITFSCTQNADKTEKNDDPRSVVNLSGSKVSVDSIEIYINKKMEEMKIPGLSMAIINDGKIAYHFTAGYGNLESTEQVTNQTIFEGASTSKSLFAHLMMFLVDEGKLDLDVPMYTYLNENLRSIYNYDQRYELITARMALSHMSGFPNWRGNSELRIEFDPGTAFGYSGEGYQFLVRVAEAVLNTDYQGLENYFQEKVARPLNLKHTKFVQDDYNRNHKANPYNNGETMEKNLWTAQEFNSASAVHSEALEFSNWIIALMNGDGLTDKSHSALFEDHITLKDAPNLLTEEGAIAWTLGLAKYELNGKIVYGHEGNNDGFNCLFLMDKSKKWAMVQFNNANEVYDFGFDLFKYINRN